MGVATAIAIIEAINVGLPIAAELILLIKKKDGTYSVVMCLDEADENFEEAKNNALEWFKKRNEQPVGG